MKTLIIFLFCLFPSQVFAPPDQGKITLMESVQFQLIFCNFSPEVLKQAIDNLTMFPEIAYAQSILETGGFTSAIFKENFNLFGMKPPARRRTYCTGINRKFATYDNYWYSILDYNLLIEYYFKQGYGMTDILKKYCPEPSYKAKLKNLMT